MMMRRMIVIAGMIAAGLLTASAKQVVIPQPAQIVETEGTYELPEKWRVSSPLPYAETEKLMAYLGGAEIVSGNNGNLQLKEDSGIGNEGYQLKVNQSGVTITASTQKGFHYGIQTLKQMVRGAESSATKLTGAALPYCEISDYPRFDHRGLMLDVTRYFIPKEEVMKIIDEMSALKLNRLHMHLTDDNGWRLEIKKYPKLTEVGAWRVDRPEYFPGRKNPTSAEEPTPIGGFYTQEDMKEIVAYAAERHIEVIPEIEMPAHAAAAIASYPELDCPVVEKFVGVFPGIGGKDADIIMCAGNEQVYDFYKGVIDEVVEIFPSEFIHLGGDEAVKRNWEKCPLCIAKIEEENLDGFEALQGYFMDRINAYVKEKGKKAIGWDEVTYGNPKEDMIIMGWQGDGGVAVRDARKSGRKFIMTPATKLYLIRYQGPQWFEPVTYFGNNTLEDAYNYEAVGKDWTPELKEQLLGIQGSIWTEFCNSNEDVEYLLFPRLIGIADAAWRPEGSGNYEEFVAALDNYLPNLKENGVVYAESMYNIQHKGMPDGEKVEIELSGGRPDLEIRYSIDGGAEQVYEAPFKVEGGKTVKANSYQGGEKRGKELVLEVGSSNFTGKKVKGERSRNGLAGVLTNGIRGSEKHSDGEWAGWFGEDAEFVVDLGEEMAIDNLKLGTIVNSDFLVVMPKTTELYVSNDGENYEMVKKIEIPEEKVFSKDLSREEINFGETGKKGRYVKVIARNPGAVPMGYAREGANTWMYFDEISSPQVP